MLLPCNYPASCDGSGSASLSCRKKRWSQEQRRELDRERAIRASPKSVYASEASGLYTCPCGGHRTLTSRGSYDLCAEVHWEDGGQDDHDSDLVRRGPNGPAQSRRRPRRSAYRIKGGKPQSTRGTSAAEESLVCSNPLKVRPSGQRFMHRSYAECR